MSEDELRDPFAKDDKEEEEKVTGDLGDVEVEEPAVAEEEEDDGVMWEEEE